MPKENNNMQVDIENLFKQNVNDLLSIKEIYSKLEELQGKITKIKYIDSNLANKLKKEYEKFKKIILDENIQVKLTDDIETINKKLNNDIETINSQMENKVKKIELEVERKRIDLLTKVENGETEGNTELLDIRVGVNGVSYETAGESVRSQFLYYIHLLI